MILETNYRRKLLIASKGSLALQRLIQYLRKGFLNFANMSKMCMCAITLSNRCISSWGL